MPSTITYKQLYREAGTGQPIAVTSGNNISITVDKEDGVAKYSVYSRVNSSADWVLVSGLDNKVLSVLTPVVITGVEYVHIVVHDHTMGGVLLSVTDS